MKGFVDKILTELKTNTTLKSEPLVKLLTESIDKSISLGEPTSSIYTNLKSGLTAINKNIKNSKITSILEQFKKIEITPESQTLKIAKKANLSQRLNLIKESKFGSSPMIKTQVELFESYLNNGTPDFALCENFISFFSNHKYDSVINAQVEKVKAYINENRSEILFLNAIYSMDNMNNQQYASVSADLKIMLIGE